MPCGPRGNVETARKAGIDDGLMLEVIANVAVNTLTNYANELAGTEIDFPVVEVEALIPDARTHGEAFVRN
jgi:hypothetical protein